ncbi:hypothetical protein Hanom_Chr08g00683521 [Helianthus anomalus]
MVVTCDSVFMNLSKVNRNLVYMIIFVFFVFFLIISGRYFCHMFTQAIDHTNDWIMERDRNKFVVVFDFLCDGIVLIINRTRTNILIINIKKF